MSNHADTYHAALDSLGQLTITPPTGRDPEELKLYGALQKGRYWRMPARLADLELMADAGIEVKLPGEVESELKRADRLTSYLQEADDLQKQTEHPAWSTLMPHQRVGVGYLASRDRALLSFTPGLGKSATAIVAADLMKYQKILVMAPLTLLPTWKREIRQWSTDADQAILRKKWEMGKRWSIVNPEAMSTNAGKVLFQQDWDLVVMDESILYKNRSAARTKNAQKLANRAKAVWLLSGAPVSAYADDLYSQLAILKPHVFRSYWRFVEHWCFTQVTPWATKIVGNKRPERLRHYLRDLMLSRTPDDVPGLLPETQFELIDVELTSRQKELLATIKQEMEWLDDDYEVREINAVIAQLTRMSQAVSCPVNLDVEDVGAKIETAKALLKGEIAQLPAIVWVHYRKTAGQAWEVLAKAGYKVSMIHGGISDKLKEQRLEAFQQGELDVLVLQIQTGKFGLSLTEANSVIFVDRSFSFDDWTQSIARVRRLSSKGKVVPTYVLHGGFSDNLVDVILNRKLKSVHDLELSDLKQLLKSGRKDA